MTDSSMLKYQYSTMLDQFILLQLHAEDPNCPCSLRGIKQGELGEFCEPKHTRAIVALARETIPMESDEARVDYLESLVLEGTELLGKMEQKLCGKEGDLGDYGTWTRDKRKPLEEWCYSGFCNIAPVDEALVSEVAMMFRKKAEPRWCYPVKETNKEIGKLSRTLGTAKKRIAEIQKHLEVPLNICRGQAEMFESTTGVLDPYGSRCRDPKTGQWVFSEECGYEPAGITTTALGMDGVTRYEFEFKIISADKLIVSHDPSTFTPNPKYPEELQPRLRERAATKIQVEKIAANLEPDAVITDFHVIDRGTPIVGPDLVVEAGNGRVMGIIRAAADYPDKYSNYKKSLRERAHDYGLSAKDVDAIENPVLIRVRITEVDRSTFTQEANQAATIAPSAIENARTDAQKITMGMLQELVIGENESLEDALRAPKNQAFAKRFLATLPENVQAALVDAQGYLNRDGVHRMAMAVFVSAFQGDPGLRLAEKAFESVDMDVRNTVNAIARSLGPLAQAEALTRTGERDTTLSIGDDLAQTINVYSAIKRNPALTIEKYLAQEQIFARELTPFQEGILVVLEEYKGSPKKLATIFTAYAEGVIKAPPPAQAALFPGAAVTKEGLWESAVKAPEVQPVLMEVARMFENAGSCKELSLMLKGQPWGAESMLAWAERLKVQADRAEGCQSLQEAAYTKAYEVIKVAQPMLKPAKVEGPMKLLTKEIRDKLPPLYSQEKVEDPMVWVKFFTPDSNWTWYGIEFDGEDRFFGWVVGFEKELGYFSLKELEAARGPMGLAIERDKWFKPMPLSEVKKLHQAELAQGTVSAIGSAAITGIGIGAGFKFVDWLATKFRKKELEEGEMVKDWLIEARKDPVVSKIEAYQEDLKKGIEKPENCWALLETIRAIRLEQLKPSEFSEQAPYARHIPKEVDVFRTTIEKHYHPTEDFHEGSIRVVKPTPDVLVYLGCLKGNDWDAEAQRCSPNPTVVKTIVPNTKEYLAELEHLKLVHPEVKINYQAKEVGVEPVLSELKGELPKDLKVTKRTFADGIYYAYDHAIDSDRARKRAEGYRAKGYKTKITKDPGGGWLIWIDEASFLALFKGVDIESVVSEGEQEELSAVDEALEHAEEVA